MITIFKIQTKQFLRSRMTVFWVVLFPVLLMLLFGYIFSDVNTTKYRLGVVRWDRGRWSGELLQMINDTGAFEVVMAPRGADPREFMDKEDLYVVLIIPDGFSENLTRAVSRRENTTLNLTVLYDPGRSESGAELGILQMTLSNFNMGIGGGRRYVGMETRTTLTKSFSYVDFYAPGLISMAVMTSSLFTAVSVNTEYRQRGILKKLATTPIKSWEWLGGIILYILFTSFLATFAILSVGWIIFSLKAEVNVFLPIFVLLDVFIFAGIGMIIGRWVKESQSAEAAANAVMFPMMFLSGIFWPIEMMPGFLQIVARLLPLYYIGEGLRNAMIYHNFSDAILYVLISSAVALLFFTLGTLNTRLQEE